MTPPPALGIAVLAARYDAARIIGAVHDGDLDTAWAALAYRTPRQLGTLAITLAAMIDPAKSLTELLAWVGISDPPTGHGTHSGYNTHKERGEEPCIWCREAQREYDRERMRRRRQDPEYRQQANTYRRQRRAQERGAA